MSESAEIKDPVCGKVVDPLRARAVGIFGGVTHYFCSPECKARYSDPRASDASNAPRGVERRLTDGKDETGEWFTKGSVVAPRAPAPAERFADLDVRDAPSKPIPLSPSLMIEVNATKKKPVWPWLVVALAVAGAAIWFFGLRG